MVALLSPTKVKLMHTHPTVCVGINKLPVKSCGEVLIEFNMGWPSKTFKARFNVIDDLIHPIVIGLPFLRENRAILDLDREVVYFGDCAVALRQNVAPAKPPPLHVAAFEAKTLPPWSKNLVKVYLKGTGRTVEEMNKTQNLYVRPFTAETNVEIPQIASHTVLDTSKDVVEVEVLNLWPHPVNVAQDMPIGLVETINPEMREILQPNEERKEDQRRSNV